MNQPDSSNTSSDPVARLMEIVSRGFHARIRYHKGGSEGVSTRVIEPRQLVDGANGLLIRAVQVEPEQGLRCFCVHKIQHVELHELPLSARSKRGNNFCTGEVVAFRMREQDARPRSETTPTTPTVISLWSTPWFTKYVGLLRDALLDLSIDSNEANRIRTFQAELQMTGSQIFAAHAYIVGEEMLAASLDGEFIREERRRIDFIMAELARMSPEDETHLDERDVSLAD